ncbi:hypothetical protein IGI39_001067 [Enterococcus sp. AZ135]|uniref:hypothetical protein n=1 Tax=unclassified Enterococcus TaxID=2608891 RepID=UPI003F22E506
MLDLMRFIGKSLVSVRLHYVAITLFLLITSVGFIIQRLRHRKREDKEDLSQYQKNEDGFYPWEVDIDDSPDRIEKDASRYVNKHQPRRGRWN